MALASGEYLTKVEKKVVVWAAADANGDGEAVWLDQTDALGNSLGRVRDKDKFGQDLYDYKPPKGFENRPGYTHQDNYVMVDDRGSIVRQPNGEAIGIKQGQALVFNPDGSVELLTDEYAQYLFSEAHDVVAETDTVPDDSEE